MTSPELNFEPSAGLVVDGVPWLTATATIPDDGVEIGHAALHDTSALTFSLTAKRDLSLSPRGFAEPSVVWPSLRATEELRRLGAVTFGYQYMEFALPSAGDIDGLGLAPWPLRPAAAFPVIWHLEGAALLIGPLDNFHEQVVAVPSNERPRADVACGWHGDLERVPAGWGTTMVAIAATNPRRAVDSYGELVRSHHHARPIGRYADPATSRLSYWTDNGATYYYRGEAGQDMTSTLVDVIERLHDDEIPVGALQLDSWFYPHKHLRGLAEGAAIVPPSGTRVWEPRRDGVRDIAALHRRSGLPLLFHSRHLDAGTPYFTDGGLAGWIDADTDHSHPADTDLHELWMEQVASWGGCTYEQDWLVEIFLTIRQLRAEPGRARAWQTGTDRAAARRGLTLQWCMATPADFLATVHLSRVSSIRTSMDFDYVVDRPANWGWFLHVNALARSLGLPTSKDVFLAARAVGEAGDASYLDPLAEAETLLAAMSCGPVGIGDPIGATDRALVMRACRADGVLVMPDVPVAALHHSFADPMPSTGTLCGEAYSDHPAGRHHYLLAVGAEGATAGEWAVERGDLDGCPAHSLLMARQWTSGRIEAVDPGDGSSPILSMDPGPGGFDLWCVSPALCDDRLAVFGDPGLYASMGDRRIGSLRETSPDTAALSVLGAAGEDVLIAGWCAGALSAETWHLEPGIGDPVATALTTQVAPDGGWTTTVTVGPQGWTRLRLHV